MKNKFIVYGILSVLSFVGCDKEDDLSWNGERTNWFEIQDKPGRFNQLAYQVYRESGLPIFVNDTIGTEVRGTDAYGEPMLSVTVLLHNWGKRVSCCRPILLIC